jgi:solute carrier family 35 protein F1/2
LQSGLNYLLLAVVYGVLHVRSAGWRLKCRWWAYALLGWLDVEGNFCLVAAYQYTSLTRQAGSRGLGSTLLAA